MEDFCYVGDASFVTTSETAGISFISALTWHDCRCHYWTTLSGRDSLSRYENRLVGRVLPN